MAFRDGMLAIAKVLKVIAVASALICAAATLVDRTFFGLFIAAGLFLLFWTPAWIIRKFVQ